MSGDRVAVVDVGSNSTRLFLCEGVSANGPEGERVTTITALKRGATPDGTIAPDALERLGACLDDYADRIAEFDSEEVIAIGTSAVRDAPNRDEVAALVDDRLGVDLRILAGAHEAELSYFGARLAVAGEGPVVVVDIGGGSTELVRGDATGPLAAVSLDAGGVRFTEQFLHDDPPSPAQIAALRDEVMGMVVPTFAAIGGAAPLVGVAGTMTSLAAIANGAYDPRVVHGAILSAVEIEDITDHLAGAALAERREVPGLHPDRAPSIVAGALIACCVLDAAMAGEIAISERDILDGAVLRLSGV